MSECKGCGKPLPPKQGDYCASGWPPRCSVLEAKAARMSMKDFPQAQTFSLGSPDSGAGVEEKPPLGIMPRLLWLEARAKELDAAIERLRDPPPWWLVERWRLRGEIKLEKACHEEPLCPG